MTLEQIVLEMKALKARVEVLEAGGGVQAAEKPGAIRREEPIEDHHLDSPWAAKSVKRDPTAWKGPSQVGKTWDQIASIEWLEKAASSKEFAAHKGRELPDSDPAKWSKAVDKKTGKPKAWHESNTFDARILRGWAERRKASPLKETAAEADDDFGFGANVSDAEKW